ncbi:MAG TPA: SurA N-terminal domain-containing protein [Terriglobales bacterium]|nr:SurA N-terminal domain-containing protein [Terriglobales bacterium]
MKSWRHIRREFHWPARGAVAALALLLPSVMLAGPIVDRVVANVNGHVVLQSDWEEEVSFEAFEDGKDPATFTEAERKAALDRLIDQELLREQVRPSQAAPSEQVAERMAEVRKLHPSATTEEGWRSALQHCGLTQKSLEARLSDQIQLMKLVEDRLRPSVHIDQQAVENYYRDRLVPELQKAGTQAKPLTEMYGRIKTLLAEQKLNELLTGWLASLRSEGHILTPDSKSGVQNR